MLTEFASGSGRMLDFFLNYAISDGVQIRLGQWRMPLSRQFVTPAPRTGLVERSDMLGQFGVSRDLGLAFHNDYERGEGFQWIVGLFNGTGQGGGTTVTQNPNTGAITVSNPTNVPSEFEPMPAVRLGYSQAGLPTYDTVDFAGGNVRVGFGLGVLIDLGVGDDEQGSFNAEADFMLAVQNFMLNIAIFMTADEVTLDALGVHTELSYPLNPNHGLLARYDRVLPDDDSTPDTDELTVGHTWFILGHSLKWQTDVSLLGIHPEVGDGEIVFWLRTQLPTSFSLQGPQEKKRPRSYERGLFSFIGCRLLTSGPYAGRWHERWRLRLAFAC